MKTANDHRATLRQAPKTALLGIGVMLASSALGGFILRQDAETAQVIVLTRDLAAGERVTIENVITQAVEEKYADAPWLTLDQLEGGPVYAASALQAGTWLRGQDLVANAAQTTLVGATLELGSFPSGIEVGQALDVWSLGSLENSMPRKIAENVFVTDFSVSEDGRSSHFTLGVQPGLVSEILAAIATDSLTVSVPR